MWTVRELHVFLFYFIFIFANKLQIKKISAIELTNIVSATFRDIDNISDNPC